MKTYNILALIAVFCMFSSWSVFAQEDSMSELSEHTSYSNFEVGSTQYLVADRVNVREKASSKADVVANLPIGKKVEIVEKTSKTLRLNGYIAYWYKVKFKHKKESKTGYIWGGLIAHGRTQMDGVTFLYGVPSVEDVELSDYTYKQIKQEVRACKDNKELSRVNIEVGGTFVTTHSMEVSDNKGVKGVNNILRIEYSDEMCGGDFGEAIVFWDGEKLHNAWHLARGVDAPYWYSEELIYPNEENGKAGKLLLIVSEGGEEVDENGEYKEYEKVLDRLTLVWTGSKLKEL